MNLQEYIHQYYNNNPNWFEAETSKAWHTERINEVLNAKEYLDGKHAILNRPDDVYNGRTFTTKKIILQYAKMICNFHKSFLLKNPITLDGIDQNAVKTMQDIHSKGEFDDINWDILDKLIKYGLIAEYLYFDENGDIQSKIIQSEDSYPVYGDSGEYLAFIEFYTVNAVSYWNVFYNDRVDSYTNVGANIHLISSKPNISGLPIIYCTEDNEENTLAGRSDLEDYVNIIDSMEELISKYHDAFYKFLNPIPVVTGTKLSIGKNGEGAIDKSEVGHALQLDDGSRFDLINSKMDSASLEKLYANLKQSLLDISMTPSIVTSGVEISNVSETSIKMLYAMAELKAGINARYLKKGFKNRWKEIQAMLKFKNKVIDISTLNVIFNPSIPQNNADTIDNLVKLVGINGISQHSLLSQSPYCYNVAEEEDRLKQEKTNINDNSSHVDNDSKDKNIKDNKDDKITKNK